MFWTSVVALLFVFVTAADMTAAQQVKDDRTVAGPCPIVASEQVIYESPDPPRVYAYSPGITILPGGRLVATLEQG